MITTEQMIADAIENCTDRLGLWSHFIRSSGVKRILEIGVYRGDFAARILKECEQIEQYNMLDPWRNLDDWNKPANKDDETFNEYLQETKQKTKFAESKCIFLRGKTTEVVDEIEDESLDFCYIDGDHTLRGISIDLFHAWKKVHQNGWIAGDDFTPTIWQHSNKYEPSMIFPQAVYFAEAINSPITAMPYSQFIIHKTGDGFQFTDLTGNYHDTSVGKHFSWKEHIKLEAKKMMAVFNLAYKND